MSAGASRTKKVSWCDSMDFYDLASKVFQYDEGDGLPDSPGKPYRDTNGYWTIGRGHLIGIALADLQLPPTAIEALFREDLSIAIGHAQFIVGNKFYESLTPARKLALVTMTFTLGKTKFLKFKETLAAIKKEDWNEAANQILNSKWAHDVDPKNRKDEGRDDRIAYMLKTGEFHPAYGIKDI